MAERPFQHPDHHNAVIATVDGSTYGHYHPSRVFKVNISLPSFPHYSRVCTLLRSRLQRSSLDVKSTLVLRRRATFSP